MLEVEQVTKRYDGKLAVDRASFNARPGRIMGLLGPNGAGKTSILRMVNDITKPDSGAVRLDGRTVGRATQAAIGYMPEERGLYKNVKVIDQLVYLGRLKGLGRDAARRSAKQWLDALDAGDWHDRRPRELSRGMQQKVQFALALVHSPRLLILDEPFSGLDPINSALMEQVIRQRKADGAIVIFASHRMEQVEGLCDEICLIANGRIVLDGELDSVKRRFGRDTVSLEFEGDGGFLDRLADAGHVDVLRNADGRAELRIQDGYSASRLLDAARAESDTLHQYSATYPTLREIFIRVVGDATDEGR
ncbi:MAG: ATP-binding cassette domain-containing protein [Gammaproteobacteria bacterium]|nr:ATP-binding cassette domain-containing protein [Gammaproteobacteria bacterium]